MCGDWGGTGWGLVRAVHVVVHLGVRAVHLEGGGTHWLMVVPLDCHGVTAVTHRCAW